QTEQVENRVGDSHRASKLFASTRECDALFSFLMNVNGHIGYGSGFMSFYLNVFFFQRQEISRSCQTRKTSFECVFVQRLTFTQTDASAKVSVWEPLIPTEFDPPYKQGRRGLKIKPHRCYVRRTIERWTSSQSIISASFFSLQTSMEP